MLASQAHGRGDLASARSLFEESLSAKRERGDLWGAAITLGNLGDIARQQEDFARPCVL